MTRKTVRIQPIAIGALYKGEANDCVIRAVCNATGEPYLSVRDTMKRFGRDIGEATPGNIMHRAFVSEFNLKVVGFFGKTLCARYLSQNHSIYRPKNGITLYNALKTYNTGNFIFIIREHAVACVDGELIDAAPLKGNASVAAIYEAKNHV